ncbi:hypothetical protein O181_025916 [Austropuccinia psidii MF-1]|uniref:Uncharacterized protein n=1 Tax=Austropuccinia psidii MF-1 TaxID=1389203 RepID=A0A9Q3CPE4_9BASI|nr:hypothetical protein [Austropuccinia psidii MF-1]
MPGQAPDDSNISLHWDSVPTIPTLPYAGAGFQRFTWKSLHWCRLLRLHTQILMAGKPPDNSKNPLLQCRLSMLHMQILTLVQVPNSSDNSLRQGSLPTILKIPYSTKINSL